MPDWTKSMQQTYEFYTVDPISWKNIKKLDEVTSCSITRDSSTDTLEQMSLDTTEVLGEVYVRPYLVTTQDGTTERFPLGTFLVQTPSKSFDGKTYSISVDAYSTLLELKDNKPQIGYTVLKGENVMLNASLLCGEALRSPVSLISSNLTTLYENYMTDGSETWLAYLSGLMNYASYEFGLDELGTVIFKPTQKLASLSPVWTFDDGNSSILYPDVSLERDLYGVPNTVEVLYSSSSQTIFCTSINDDPNSETSTVTRGRTVLYRVTNPEFSAEPSEEIVQAYADDLLKELSTIEYTITYKHGYCPVRVGDAVRLNYISAGLDNVKAKVISQKITCESGCPVEETAVFTQNFMGDNLL